MRTGTEREYGLRGEADAVAAPPSRIEYVFAAGRAMCRAKEREPYARRGIRYGPNGADIAGRVFREQNHLTPNVLGEWSD